jgi:enoyl-[acyl-carrier-protein] reductase (NADH)
VCARGVRVGEVTDVANVAFLLASELSGCMKGAVLKVTLGTALVSSEVEET